jgi:hypothetical protein
VGVDNVAVQPGLLVGAQPVRVEFADRDNGVLDLPVNLVAVHVQGARELVVGPVLLELGERVRDQVGVQQPDVGRGLRVGGQGARGGVGGGVVDRLLDLIQAVGRAGHVDVPLDVLLLERLLRGADLELLDHPGVDAAGQDGGDDEHGGADDGQPPLADHGGDDEQHGHEDRGHGQDGFGGDDGVDVRVQRTGPAAAAVLDGGVAVQPEVGAQQEQEGRTGDGEMDLRRAAGEDAAFHDPDAAVEVVRQDAGDAGDDGDADQEAGDEAQERQGHQVEADVEPELRIVLAEGLLVQEQEHLLPLAGRGASGEQAEEDRQADHHDAADRFKLDLVAVQVVPDVRVRCVHRAGVVGDPDGEEDGGEHQGEAGQEDGDACQVLGQEDFEEAQLLVPEDVRPDIGEEDEADHDQGHHNQRRRQCASSLLGSSGRDSAGGTGQTRYLIAGRQLLVFSYLCGASMQERETAAAKRPPAPPRQGGEAVISATSGGGS